MIRVRRVYEEPQEEDGLRILVDRLWPRGLSKYRAQVHLWLKEVAPSDELRHWFAHEPARWDEFRRRYREELASGLDQVGRIRTLERERGTVTLLYAARDDKHNNAVVLGEMLRET